MLSNVYFIIFLIIIFWTSASSEDILDGAKIFFDRKFVLDSKIEIVL